MSKKLRLARFLVLFILTGLISCGSDESESILECVTATPDSVGNKPKVAARHSSPETLGLNLLVNGGLEDWIPLTYPIDIPKGWFCHNNINVKKNHDIYCDGYYSARMKSTEKGSTARIDQRIAVYPGQRIRIRFCYYVEQWKTKGARTYCYFRTDAAEQYNISADDLIAYYGKPTCYIIRGGGYNQTYLPHELYVWHVFDEVIEVPPTAYYFVFGVNSYYGTTIYVDDCWVIDVTDGTSTSIRPVTI